MEIKHNKQTILRLSFMQWPVHFKENKRNAFGTWEGRKALMCSVLSVKYRLKSDLQLFINSGFIWNYRRAVTGLILAKWTDPISLGIVLHIWRKREEVLIIFGHSFCIVMKYFWILDFVFLACFLESWPMGGEKSLWCNYWHLEASKALK